MDVVSERRTDIAPLILGAEVRDGSVEDGACIDAYLLTIRVRHDQGGQVPDWHGFTGGGSVPRLDARLMPDMSCSALPTVSPDAVQKIVPKRYWKFALYLLSILFGILAARSLFSSLDWDDDIRNWPPFAQRPQPQNLSDSPDYPPNYAEWHKIEEALPQHNQSLPFPEGKEGRYVYFSEHVKSTPTLLPIPFISPGIPDHLTPQQRRGGGTYSRSTSSRACWPTSGGDRA